MTPQAAGAGEPDISAAPAEGRLIVGMDGSPGSEQALQWALREAQLSRRSAVVAVLAYGPLGRPPALDGLFSTDVDELTSAANALLDKSIAQVTPVEQDHPAVEVMPALVYDEPVGGLLDLASKHDTLVLGSRGWGRLRRLVMGSVATQCLLHHHGPVVIVREPVVPGDRRPVLVGFDGSEASRHALSWAAAFAGRRQASLRAVQARSVPISLHPTARSLLEDQSEIDHMTAELRRVVRNEIEDVGPIEFSVEILSGSAPAAILGMTDDHQLLVLGRIGRSSTLQRLLGSTSLSCALNAPGTVAVIGS